MISTGAVTGGVTLLSVIVSVSFVERVAPRCTVSAAVLVQVQVDAGTVVDANGASVGQAGRVAALMRCYLYREVPRVARSFGARTRDEESVCVCG